MQCKGETKMVKQLVYLSIFSLMHTAASMDALWIDEEDPIQINSFTLKVQQRYYYLARLAPIHDVLEYIKNEPTIAYSYDYTVTLLHPTHPHIRHCVEDLQKTQSFEPLFELWDEFKAYKFIDDHECLAQYAALVCTIVQQIMETLELEFADDAQRALNAVQKTTRTAPCVISSHDVAYRYYLLKRLKNVTQLLKHCSLAKYRYALCSSLPAWTNTKIVICAKTIEQTQSLDSLLDLLKELEQYAHINDIVFMHELLELILFIEQHGLAPYYLPKKKELCAHYEHAIDGLTIEELLQSIDILTAHIDPYAFETLTKQVPIPQVQSFGAIVCAGFIAWYASQTWGA